MENLGNNQEASPPESAARAAGWATSGLTQDAGLQSVGGFKGLHGRNTR